MVILTSLYIVSLLHDIKELHFTRVTHMHINIDKIQIYIQVQFSMWSSNKIDD